MSKQFGKHCRENMTQLHLGDFQPVFLAAAGGTGQHTSGCPRTAPHCPGGTKGLGAAPAQTQRETAGKRKLSSEWSHSA